MNRSKLMNVLMVSAGLSLLQPLSAFAGTITITDSTDGATITLSPDISARTGATASCIGEVCTAFVPNVPNAGAGGDPPGINYAHHDLLEPGSSTISDILALTQVFNPDLGLFTGFALTFTSDSEAGLGISTAPNDFAENGSPQQAGYINWDESATAPTIDTISVQSDIDAPTGVPEPISLTLFGAGLIGMGALRRLRARPKVKSAVTII